MSHYVEVDLEKKLYKQLIKLYEKTIGKYDDILVTVNKMGSLYKLIKILQNDFKTNHIIIKCLPYSGDKLHIDNNFTYCVVLDNNYVTFYINNHKIITSGSHIVVDNFFIKNDDFILDIFKLFKNIKYYSWNDKTNPCNFHKNGLSAKYGGPSITYTRVKDHIIEINIGGCCCNYSGDVSYYDIYTDKLLYQSCNCFRNQYEIDKAIV